MEQQVFQTQARRLIGTFGDRNYPQERIEILWRAFQAVPDLEFEEVVTECIANSRHAPMLDDMTKVHSEVRERRAEALRLDAKRELGDEGIAGVVSLAARRAANKEFSGACQKVLGDFLTGKLSAVQFSEACGYLADCARQISRVKACRVCDGGGIAFLDTGIARCDCPAGDKQPAEFVLKRANGEERIPFRRAREVKTAIEKSARDRAAGEGYE